MMSREYSLLGIDGNAFSIMGYVQKAMKDEGFSERDITEYLENAKSRDYNHLIAVSVDMIHEVNSKIREEK